MEPPSGAKDRFLRPIVPILITLLAASASLFVGDVLSQAQGAAALRFSAAIPYLIVGALLTYLIAVLASDSELWALGTREVVYMAIGAALYGVLSWLTNLVQLPSISQVAFRPAIVIPIFFGVIFGPVVGFFTGFVGNVLGDALSGWGVFPIWNIGNGLIGLVAGLSLAFRSRKRALDVLVAVIAGICLLVTLLILINPVVIDPNGNGTATMDVGDAWWIPLLGFGLVIGIRYLLRGRENVAAAQVWGALGIIIGIGFAALADVFYNGYSLLTALLGEFLPAAGTNMINALILLPLLLSAWSATRVRQGR